MAARYRDAESGVKLGLQMFRWVLKVWVAATAFRQPLHTSKHTLSPPGREVERQPRSSLSGLYAQVQGGDTKEDKIKENSKFSYC